VAFRRVQTISSFLACMASAERAIGHKVSPGPRHRTVATYLLRSPPLPTPPCQQICGQGRRLAARLCARGSLIEQNPSTATLPGKVGQKLA
jgi:hypothetical protein